MSKKLAGWSTKRVEEICDLGRGRVISQEEIQRHPGAYPVYSSQSKDEGVLGSLDIYDFDGDYVTWTTDGANAGTVFFRTGKFNCTNVCGTLRPKSLETSARFLARALSTVTKRHVSYVGNPKLMNNIMAAIQVRMPPRREQDSIAAVLDAIDEAIAKMEAVIAKLKQVRAGLLHDLLTCGLDEHGQLRDPVAHPEQFQDSPLGRIPREWEIAFVGQLFEMQLGKMLSPKAKAGGDSRPYIGNRHVLWDRVDCSDLEYMDFAAEERVKFALRVDDLLVCEGGEVGRTAIWRSEVSECFFQKAIHRLRPKDDRIIPQYMLAFMKRAAERGAFVNLTSQTSIAHLTQEKLAILPVVLPPRIEQERMIAAWSTLDVEQRHNEEFLAKLNQLKSGLMNDLLTGRVRVPETIMDGGAQG